MTTMEDNLRKYEEQKKQGGAKQDLGTLALEDYFKRATGTMEPVGVAGKEHVVEKAPAGHEGKFYYNNGVLAFVDMEGNYHVGPLTPERVQLLREAGYEQSGIYVPHSNDGGRWIRGMFQEEIDRLIGR